MCNDLKRYQLKVSVNDNVIIMWAGTEDDMNT